LPVDTYKIQLEPIKDATADVTAKKLALKIAQLNNTIVALEKAMQRSASIQKEAQRTGGTDPRAIRANIDAANKLVEYSRQLNALVSHLTASFKELPKAIGDAISTATTTAKRLSSTVPTQTIQLPPEIKEFTKELVQARRNVNRSATYHTQRVDVTSAIDKVIRELSLQKRDISDLTDAIRGLVKSIGNIGPVNPGEAKHPYPIHTDVKLLGKTLKDMGGDFEKIKKELGNKTVVSFDLETSAASNDLAKRLGKTAATEFITQIAYQKGKLSDIISGNVKNLQTGNVYIKPPAENKEEYLKKLTKDAHSESAKTKIRESAVPFETLKKHGIEANEAMSKIADVLKDAEAVVGHNIADFDISVLQQHLEKAGIKIDSAVEEFVDTVKLARHNFPERFGKGNVYKGLQPHSLEQYDKDFILAGVEAKKAGDKLHDASTDIGLTAAVMRALDKGSKEFQAAQSNASTILRRTLDNIAGATADAHRAIKESADNITAAGQDFVTLSTQAKKASKVMANQIVEISNLPKIRSAIQTRVYKEATIRPMAEAGAEYRVKGTGAEQVSEKVRHIWGDLAKSLYDLQKNMVISLEKGMTKGLKIWKDSSGKSFKLGEGGRQWEVRLADVRGLRKELSSTFREQVPTGSGPGDLVRAFKDAFVRREMAAPTDKEDMAAEVYKEVGSLTKESVSKMGKIVEDLYKGIQNKAITEEDVLKRGDVEDLYKNVALQSKADREVMDRFVKVLAVPAAKVTPQGTMSFETKYGSEKALANFATITTGFEKMVKELELLGAPAMEIASNAQKVSRLPLRIESGTKQGEEASKLFEELQKRILQLGGRDLLQHGYTKAIRLREMERGVPAEKALEDVTDVGLGGLIKKAKELNVAALDVAKALDEIKFENFYDMLNKLFQSGQKPLLQEKVGSIRNLGKSERSLRQISSVVNDLMGLMPAVEPGKPKRREYDEQALRVLTKPVGELKPEESKKHIVDVDLLWKDLASQAEKLKEGLFTNKPYLGRPMASSLDLSDAASSSLKQFNLDLEGNLKSLDKTMNSMSLADIRGLAPFQQFASTQRQMSYATSAIGGGVPGGEKFETPSLVSKKESELIGSGRYGSGGYGLNVLTELRNTASTFEDQIMISGRLAKAFTKITSNLIRPGATLLEQQHISEVQGGVQRMTPAAARMLSKSEEDFKRILGDVVNKFQDILGVPEKYKGRADIAEIAKVVEPVIREHRGQTTEVQSAKLTETFLNYFGRKLSTRFGTKGVAVTPRYGELPKGISSMEDVSKFINAGFKAGVSPGPGLGVAKMPKSVGRMVSEVLEEELGGLHTSKASMELHNKLIDSGNKFVIDMFKDASKGLVIEEEAKSQAELSKKAFEAWKPVFRTALPTGPEGIKEIKSLYKERTGKEPFTMEPIEARISSRGIAKRGLTPEILEGIVNNLIGSTSGTTTLVDKIGKDALTETTAARKKLNEYLSAIGFEAFKDLDKVIKNLKFENPGIDKDAIDKLKKFESQWKVYTDVVDEFGKKRQSFVSPKFLQIIEEPHRNKEWAPEEISKGVKGEKLDFQSFAAMMGVFGKGSSMMKELAKGTTLASKEGWELLRAFQMLDPAMKNLKEHFLKTLPSVKLSDVRGFEAATGTIKDFKDTVFDIGKHPTAFKLNIPTAKGPYEELPVPGAALRTTYREQLIGKGAPTDIARYLANLVNAAKAVEDLTAAAAKGGMGLNEDVQRKFADTIRKELTTSLTEDIKKFKKIEDKGALTPQNIKNMENTINKFKAALSPTRNAPGVYQEVGGISELGSAEAFAAKTTGKHKYSQTLGRIADLLIGADPNSLIEDMNNILTNLKKFKESGVKPDKFKNASPDQFRSIMQSFIKRNELRGAAKSAFDVELEAGNLDQFAQKIGIDVSESIKEAIQQKLESLSRAKISYFRELGKEVFGKKKGVENVFFQRITPAVTGKAISAVTDKTKELNALLNTLSGMRYSLHLDMPGLDDAIKSIRELSKEHADYITKAKKLGLPVLKEGEIAIPESQAKKIAVRTGENNEVETNLADLIKKQKQVFVESVRYPFTGTLSVQPAKAKLMEEMGLNLGKHSIAVPGAPKLDIAELTKVIDTLKEYVGVVPTEKRQHIPKETLSLLQQREKAWASGTEQGAEKARKLTHTIEGLLKVVNDATPKFSNLEQKLDFDGDALFVHTGKLEESRKEIAAHFKALGDDVNSVRTLFRSLFTAVKESDVSTLAEMAQVFSKKHPAEKGFGFLTKPYITDEMKGLNLDKVMSSLFTYQKGAANIEKKGGDEWKKAVADWAKGFVTNDILPEVFKRLGVSGPERASYLAKVPSSKEGIPEATSTSTELDRRISGLSEELVRRQLWEKRYADAITGQLYKLHTGQTVEGVSRIARVSEIETGFGKGLAGTGKAAAPSPEFLKAFPKESIALGGRPVQEFGARVNEIMRFVIQKGMDVKHAGVEAVGRKIISNIGKANGAEIIMKAMKEAEDQFGELVDFNEQIENEVKLRLGKVSTGELKKELKRFEPDIDTSTLNMSRENIMQLIIKHVNLEAVFEELFRQIKREAIKGYTKQLQEKAANLPPGPQKVKMMQDIEAAGSPERFATEEINKAAAGTGVSLFKYITTNLQPLYRMRTSMETMGTAAARSGIKVAPTEMTLPTGEAGEKLAKQFETAEKAAHALSQAMESSITTPGKGIYTSMVVGAVKQRYKDLEELEKLDEGAKKFTGRFDYAFTGAKDANKLAAKIWSESKELADVKAPNIMPTDNNIIGWLDQMNKIKKVASKKLEAVSEKAGLPPMAPEEKSLLASQFESKHGAETFKNVKDIISQGMMARKEQIVPADLEKKAQTAYERILDFVKFQISFVEQLRRISEITKTVPMQKMYLKEAFPGFKEGVHANIGSAGIYGTPDYYKRLADKEKMVTDLLEQFGKGEEKTTLPNIEKSMKAMSTAAQSTVAGEDLGKEAVAATDEITNQITKEVVSRTRDALRYLESKSGGKARGAIEKPLYDVFRASGSHAGGVYGGGSQSEAILREMLGVKDPSMLLEATGLRGQAVHRKIQGEFLKKYPKAEIEQPMRDTENDITGHFDVLYNKAGQETLTDIKTVYSQPQFRMLKSLTEEITKRKITIQEKLEELKKAGPKTSTDKNVIRRLEDYLSQVNIYLKNTENAVGEILVVNTLNPDERFTIPIGKFDPKRFDKDIKAINDAKIKVHKILESINTTGLLPEDILKEYPKLYEDLGKKLGEIGPKKFLKTLPTQPVGETPVASKTIIKRLTEEQQAQFERLSKEYIDMFESLGGPGQGGAQKYYKLWFASGAGAGGAGGAGAPPTGGAPPPPTGPGGDGGDDEFRKRIKALLERLKNTKEPDVADIDNLVRSLKEAEDRAAAALYRNTKGDKEIADILSDLADRIRAAIEATGGMKSAKKISELYGTLNQVKAGGAARGGADFSKLRAADIDRIHPDRPESMHKNLIALYEAAVRVNRLADPKEADKYGSEIAKLLKEAAEKGPSDISPQISQAISKLPPEKKGGMARIWMLYKKAVGEYFLKRLDHLKSEIESEGASQKGRKAYMEYEQVLESYLANIRGTIGHMSDMFTTKGPSGKKTQFVDTDLARLTGIYKTPKQIEETVNQSNLMSGEYKPIMTMLVGDLDPATVGEIAKPIDKVRAAFKMLTDEDKGMKALLSDVDTFKRLGPEAVGAWDFDRLVKGITQLRGGLESYNRLQIGGFGGLGEDYTEPIRKNVTDTLNYLKQLEKMFSAIGAHASPMGTVGVPTFLSPKTQELLHRRNIVKVRQAFQKPEEEGGFPMGKAFTYRYKIIDPATKQTIENTAVEFKKLGDSATSSGRDVGIFSEKWEDLIKSFQNRRSFGQAFGRVIRWGFASRTVYGLISAMQNMVSTISDVELGIAALRQVMSPLDSDFNKLTDTALQFGKEFGLPIRQVIASMKVFAQQGLSQNEVLDRTRTSLLAANVSTLSSVDATEALTAATKIYGTTGESTIRFLDAWSQVEARHAITSKDLALGLQKAAAVAKTAGVSFDQLNAIITGIGETSRQTGKQIGTSLVFILRRMHAKKGEGQLINLGIPTVGRQGDIRSAFDILGGLASKWDELSNAQRLSIAQAIGGRRHYNNLIILMNHWSDVLDTLQDSINSKGAAERRNAIVMETYAKKVQQVKAAMVELQVQFGKFALPVAKVVLSGLKGVIETITNIPASIKIASLAFSGLFVLIAKGSDLVGSLFDRFKSFGSVIGDFAGSFSKELKIGLFESFGKVPKGLGSVNTKGLSVVTQAGKSMSDFESVLGKASFALVNFGRMWNSIMSEVAYGGAKTSDVVSKSLGGLGGLLTKGATASIKVNPILSSIMGGAAKGAKYGSKGFEELAKLFGIPAKALALWSTENASFVKSVGPLAGSIAALIPVAGKLGDEFKKLTYSASGYEKSLSPIKRHLSGELSLLTELSKEYSRITLKREKIAKYREPEAAERAVAREEYKSPLLEEAKNYTALQSLGNNLASVNNKLIISFDKFGNAVLKSSVHLESYLKSLETSKIAEMADKDIAALEKYTDSLTNAGTGFEKFKSELKKFTKEVPGIGPLISKMINVSPAQELSEAVGNINKILSARRTAPFGKAFDGLFKVYNDRLIEIRKKYKTFYGDSQRLLSSINTRGLSTFKVSELFSGKGVQPIYKLAVEIEPRLAKLSKEHQLDWKDVMGATILKKLHPDITLDVAAPLTKEMLKQSGVIKREGKAFANDIVFFAKDLPRGLEVASRQGILQYDDKLKQFTVQIVDKFGAVSEVPFDKVKKFVDSVFPTHKIMDGVQDNIDILEEFLTGAAAGMTGLGSKEFKKSFNLGPRFFGQIPTTTLMQTTMGYNPISKNYGQEPFKEKMNFPKLVQDFYIKPMEDLHNMIQEPQKRLAAGKPVSPALREDIEHQKVLIKNNQAYIQYMALLVDLNKTLNDSDRALEETIAAEKTRNKYLIETSGLLSGIPQSFKELNLGVRDYFKLTGQQRQLFKEKGLPPEQQSLTNIVRQLNTSEIKKTAYVSEAERISKAIVQLNTITAQNNAAGNILSTEDVSNMAVAVKKGLDVGQAALFSEAAKTSKHTGTTNLKLEEIKSILAKPAGIYKAGEIVKVMSEDIKRLNLPSTKALHLVGRVSPWANEIKAGFDRLTKIRTMYESKGNTEAATSITAMLSKMSTKLVEAVGVKRAVGIVSERPASSLSYRNVINRTMAGPSPAFLPGQESFYKGKFNPAELISSVFEPGTIKSMMAEIQKRGSGQGPAVSPSSQKYENAVLGMLEYTRFKGIVGSSEYKDLQKSMDKQANVNVVGSKNLAKLLAGIGGFELILKNVSRREIRGYEAQKRILSSQQADLYKRYKAGEVPKAEFQTQMSEFGAKRYQLSQQVVAKEAEAKERATIEAIALVASASTEFARYLGLNEQALKVFGTTAASSIVAWKAWNVLTGEKMPKVISKAIDAMKDWAKDLSSGPMGWKELNKFELGEFFGTGFGTKAGKAGAAVKAAGEYIKKQREVLTPSEKEQISSTKALTIRDEDLRKAGVKNISDLGTAGGQLLDALGVKNKELLTLFGKAAIDAIAGWKSWSEKTGKKAPEEVTEAMKNLKKWVSTFEEGKPSSKGLNLFQLGKVSGIGFGSTAEKAGASIRKVLNRETLANVFKSFLPADSVLTKKERESSIAWFKNQLINTKYSKLIQDRVKKATDTLNKLKGSDVKKLDKDTKMLDINQKQLIVLSGIESNTRQTAEDSSSAKEASKQKDKPAGDDPYIKKLRESIDEIKQGTLSKGGDVASKFKDAVAAALLVTSAGYLGQKTELNSQIGQASKQASDVTDKFLGLLHKYPVEVGNILNEFQKKSAASEKAAAEVPAVTSEEKKQVALKHITNDFIDQLYALAKAKGEEISGLNRTQSIKKELAYIAQVKNDLAKTIEDFGLSLSNAALDMYADIKHAADTIGPMKGVFKAPEYGSTKSTWELSPTNTLMKMGGKEWQNAYARFQLLEKDFSGTLDIYKRTQKEAFSRNISYNKEHAIAQKALDVQKMEAQNLKARADQLKPGNIYSSGLRNSMGEVEKGIGKRAAEASDRYKESLNEVEKATDELNIKKHSHIAVVKAQTNALESLSDHLTMTKSEIADLKTVLFEAGIGLAKIITSFENLKHSFQMDTQMQAFNQSFNDIFKNRPGGPGANAPVIPTMNLVRSGFKLSDMNLSKQQAAIAEIIQTKGRGPTLAEQQDIAYKTKRATFDESMAKAVNEVQRQQKLASNVYSNLISTRSQLSEVLTPGGAKPTGAQKDLFAAIDQIITAVQEQNKTAGIFKQTGPNSVGPTGFNFNKIEEMINTLITNYSKNPEVAKMLKENGISIGELIKTSKAGFEVSPTIKSLNNIDSTLDKIYDKHTELLTAIASNTANTARPDQQNVAAELYGPIGASKTKKATGGTITGPGGPREDKVPIMASPGEFIVKADSAKKLGKSNLEFINKTGQLPKFAGGGLIPNVNLNDFGPSGVLLRSSIIGKYTFPAGWSKKDVESFLKDPSKFYDKNYKFMPDSKQLSTDKGQYTPKVKDMSNLPPKNFGKPLKSTHGVIRAGGLSLFKDENDQWVMTDNPSKYTPKYADPVRGIPQAKDMSGQKFGTPLKSLHGVTTAGSLSLFKDKSGHWVMTDKPATYEHKYAAGGEVSSFFRKHPNLYGMVGAGKAVGQSLGKGALDLGKMFTDPFVNLYKGRGNQAVNTINAFMNAMPFIGGAGSLIKSGVKGVTEVGANLGKNLLSRAKLPRLLAEETGLALPGGPVQMVGGIARSAAKKALPEISTKLEMENESLNNRSMSRLFHSIDRQIRGALAKDVNVDVGAKLSMEKAATTKMPSYKRTPEMDKAADLLKSIDYQLGETTYLHPTAAEVLYRSPHTKDILKEIPKGAKFIKGEAGVEAFALDLPDNKVMRIGDLTKPRLKIPEVLQAESRKEFGNIQIEVMPRVKGIRTAGQTDINMLQTKIAERGKEAGKHYDFWDTHSGNVGYLKGQPVVIDPGAIKYFKGGMISSSHYQKGGAIDEKFIEYMAKEYGIDSQQSGKTTTTPRAALSHNLWEKAKKLFGPNHPEENPFAIGAAVKSLHEDEQKRNAVMKALFGRDDKQLNNGISKYEQGTPYVPNTQLAVVHQGEAVIPAKYNMGGLINRPGFAAGGAVDALKIVGDAGEKIGEAIVKKLEGAEVKLSTTEVTAKLDKDSVSLDVSGMQDIVDELKSVKVDINIPTAEDMPKLEIGNLSDLKTILSEKPSGAVGAEKGASKIDQFIDVANDKFDRLEEKVVQFDDTIKIVNDTTKELNEIKVKSEDLENKLYSKLDSTVDRNADRSYVDRRLQEIASELKNEDLQIINSRLFNVESNMSKLQNVIDNQSDIMFSNINRLDLR